MTFTQYQLTGNAQPLDDYQRSRRRALVHRTRHQQHRPSADQRFPAKRIRHPDRQRQARRHRAGPRQRAMVYRSKRRLKIGRISTAGVVTAEYPLPNAMTPDQILQGIDGNFYFTDTAEATKSASSSSKATTSAITESDGELGTDGDDARATTARSTSSKPPATKSLSSDTLRSKELVGLAGC